MSIKNIVLFGETGAGKSSVVNLMAGKEIATTSLSPKRCTSKWEEYHIGFNGYNYKVFDTVGLEDPQLGIKEYLDAIVNARNLIMKLEDEGGIDLLLFCVRAERVTETLQNNYRLFYEWLCEKKAPIVLVLTGLEREEHMEDWWTRNKAAFDKYGIDVQGHACITAANELDGRHQQLYEESRQLVRNLVRQHTYGRSCGWKGGGWLRRFMGKLRVSILGNPNKKYTKSVLIKRCGMPQEAAVELVSWHVGELRQKKFA